jgi:hypothetical protein
MNWKEYVEKRSWSIGSYPWVYLRRLRKPRKTSAVIAAVQAETGTRHFPNKRP